MSLGLGSMRGFDPTDPEAKTSAVEHAGAQGVFPTEAHLPRDTLTHQPKPKPATRNAVSCLLKGGLPKTHQILVIIGSDAAEAGGARGM